MLRRASAYLLFILLCFLAACGSGSPSGSTTGSFGGLGAGKLYVSNAPANAILRFDNALNINGNVPASATISGSNTQLANPQYLFLDVANDRLLVANPGTSAILVFDNVSTLNGNVMPKRVISGPQTHLLLPRDLALDKTRNLLYVADGGNILVFAAASSATGDVSPVHTITPSPGVLIGAILVDSANDRLFVTDMSGNRIDVFVGASTLQGSAVAPRTISGSTTQLAQPAGVQIDSSDRLIVSNMAGPSITFYLNAATISGNQTPSATISGGNTELVGPTQMFLNPSSGTGELYVADGSAEAVLIIANIASQNGNILPTRTIRGPSTGLARTGAAPTATGVALDTSR